MLNPPIRYTFAVAFALTLTGTTATAQAPPKQEPSSEADMRAALTGGVPGGRWKEGLMFEGISPQPVAHERRQLVPGHRG